MAVIGLLLLALVFGPQLWVRWAMRTHSAEDTRLPGTGGQLAEHLLSRFCGEAGPLDDFPNAREQSPGSPASHSESSTANVTQFPGTHTTRLPGTPQTPVRVVQGGANENHFDPIENVVSLAPEIYQGRSLTAVAIAAHEVGHAIQYHRREPLMDWRIRAAPMVAQLRRFGVILLTAVPVVLLVTRVPGASLLLLIGGLCAMGSAIIFHLLTLPMELDASFNKALPILIDGDYVKEADLPPIRTVLRAAAFTYVAGAIADLLNIGRWLAILR